MKTDKENSIFNGIFGDARLDNRMGMLMESIINHGSAIINRNSKNKKEKIGAYRMINNSKLELESLITRLKENCTHHLDCGHVLCIQDTTEVNYTQIQHRLDEDDPDVGPITKNSNVGFFCHPTLVMDADKGIPLGFSDILLWSRSKDKGNKRTRKYSQKRIEDKESIRWIDSVRRTSRVLPGEIQKTVIADRESDIYDALYRIPLSGCDYILRSSSDRNLDAGECLSQKMKSLSCTYRYTLTVKGNHSRKNRQTEMELRFGNVTLLRPSCASPDCPERLSVNCIHVVETGNVPSNESPIEWRLLTTHQIETATDAMRVVEWYKMRWYIEEIFRLIKSQGLDVESVQLESGEKLQKMVVICLAAALRIMSLKISYDRKDENTTAGIIFDKRQIALLEILLEMVEGKTLKQKNPFKHKSLAWASWIIERLGAWDGYQSQGPPGYITFTRGMQTFGGHWRFYEFVNKDV